MFEISHTIFEKNYAILREKYGTKEISLESALAVGAITGSKRLLQYVGDSEKGEVNMCKALEELVEQGKSEGRLEGKERVNSIVKNMIRRGLDIYDIVEMTEMPLETVQKMQEELQSIKE